MNDLNTLQEKLAVNLARELGYSSPAEAQAGPFDSLLDKLIEIALNLVENCLSNNPLAAVLTNLVGPGLVQRMAIRKAIRIADIERPQRRPSEDALFDTLSQLTPTEVQQLATTVDRNRVDWSIF